MSISLAQLLGETHRIDQLTGSTQERIVAELLQHLASVEDLPEEAIEGIQRVILTREQEATTGIGKGIAIPHMKDCPHIDHIVGVFGRSAAGIEWGATDGEPVHLVFLVLTPTHAADQHIEVMKKIVMLSRDGKTLGYLIQAEKFGTVDDIFREIDDQAL